MRNLRAVLALHAPRLDEDIRAARRVLDGVPDQVLEELLEPVRVRDESDVLGHAKARSFSRSSRRIGAEGSMVMLSVPGAPMSGRGELPGRRGGPFRST